MFYKRNLFIQTNPVLLNISILLLRISVGLIVFDAGAGKVFGWFGGYGLKKTLEAFRSMMGISAFWAYVSSYTELIGGLLLIIGLFTRPAAFAVMINMLVATLMVGLDKFFTGFGDFPFILMIGSLVILLAGPMAYSVDGILLRTKEKRLST